MTRFVTVLLIMLQVLWATQAQEYTGNFILSDVRNDVVGYQEDVTFSLAGREWFASDVYKNQKEFRLGNSKSTPIGAALGGGTGAHLAMQWDMVHVNKIELTCDKAQGLVKTWEIYESTDQGTTWACVAQGTTALGTWTYTTHTPQERARYAFVVKGSLPRTSLSTVSIYTGLPPKVEQPTYTPTPGTYYDALDVTISSATPSASIYYTTDGTVPTSTNAMLYSTPIRIEQCTEIQAIAVLGEDTSQLNMGKYTLALRPATALPPTQVSTSGFTAQWNNAPHATSHTLHVNEQVLNTDPGNGTSERPYTVKAFQEAQLSDQQMVHVRGYIVGMPTKTGTTVSYIPSATNDQLIVLADATGEGQAFIPVNITNATMQKSWGLKSNPQLLDTYVQIQSNTGNIFGILGLQAPESIEECTNTRSQPIAGTPFVLTDTSIVSLQLSELKPSTTYTYYIVGHKQGYVDSPPSGTISASTTGHTALHTTTTNSDITIIGSTIHNSQLHTIHIYNTLGQLLHTSSNEYIDLNHLSHGTYFARTKNTCIVFIK